MIEFGSRLCYLSISESCHCMKEPEIGVFGPKIREFNGHLGDTLHGGGSSGFFYYFLAAIEDQNLNENVCTRNILSG